MIRVITAAAAGWGVQTKSSDGRVMVFPHTQPDLQAPPADASRTTGRDRPANKELAADDLGTARCHPAIAFVGFWSAR